MKYLLLLAPLLCGFSTFRIGTTLASRTWADPNVIYYVDQSGITSLTDDSDIAAIYQAFAAWNTVACSAFRFVDGGLRASDPGGNFIRFAHTSTGWPEDPGVIAFTLLPGGGDFTSADIYVNDFSMRWSTSGELRAFDLQSVITHELGHALGLAHSADPTATMYYSGDNGNTFFRTLAPDDVKGVCYLYPAATTPCSGFADCPMLDGTNEATVCTGGSCAIGDRPYGGDCWDDSNCAGAGGVCVRYNLTPATDPGICTQACPCPAGDVCASAPGGVTRCAPRGTACATGCNTGNHKCAPSVDGQFVCLQICIQDVNCTEATNDFCFDPIDADDAGICRVRGAKADGEPCNAPSECQSLICGSGLDGVAHCAAPDEDVDPPDPPPDTGGGPDGGDPAGGDSVGDPLPGDASEPDPSDPAGSVDGGCASSTPSFALVMGAMVVVLFLVQRTRVIRKVSQGREPSS